MTIRAHARRVFTPALAVVSLLTFAGCGAAGKRGVSSTLVSIGAGLKGPVGLKATVYARGPETVAAFAFDRRGRLWVTAAGLSTHTHDGVYVVAKAGGRALKVVSGSNDPLGVAWVRNKLYVASLGRVDAFGGFDGRRFTKRTRILSRPVSGGENNLLVLAPDGRLARAGADWARVRAGYEQLAGEREPARRPRRGDSDDWLGDWATGTIYRVGV